MPRHIAFLRAVNVGGRVVKMDLLRTLFEKLGHTEVETFIASGNVIFESRSKNVKSLERAIEARLRDALGYEVTTFLRTPAELAGILKFEPFPKSPRAKGDSLYIGFLAEAPAAAAVRALEACTSGDEEFRVRGRELYWLLRGNFRDSKFSGARLEKMLGTRATIRNVTTVEKLAAKYA
ncbi:MAG TPA: DUF1697 domain-containing protein [Thermoanaerobaculia bacterium]|jgi:uncharacterized protein (DUF1697 family)